MDWTTNPLVALYFSARRTKRDDDGTPLDSAVYVLTSRPARYSDLDASERELIRPVGDTSTEGSVLYDLDAMEAARITHQEGDYEEWLAEGSPGPDYEADEFSEPDDYGKSEGSVGDESESEYEFSTGPLFATVAVRRQLSQANRDSPFGISENMIYDPPHVSPRIRAQDGVLMACHQPMQALEEKDYLEIVIKHEAHDEIRRRLDQYGVFDKQLFPDLDGIAKWLKYRVFEIDGKC
jgi:hypothetical protein